MNVPKFDNGDRVALVYDDGSDPRFGEVYERTQGLGADRCDEYRYSVRFDEVGHEQGVHPDDLVSEDEIDQAPETYAVELTEDEWVRTLTVFSITQRHLTVNGSNVSMYGDNFEDLVAGTRKKILEQTQEKL